MMNSFLLLTSLLLCNCLSSEIKTDDHIIDEEHQLSKSIKSSCETIQTKIHVNKEEHDQAGNVIRSCEGSIQVNKCEGTCVSQLQPSVNKPNGFSKVI